MILRYVVITTVFRKYFRVLKLYYLGTRIHIFREVMRKQFLFQSSVLTG